LARGLQRQKEQETEDLSRSSTNISMRESHEGEANVSAVLAEKPVADRDRVSASSGVSTGTPCTAPPRSSFGSSASGGSAVSAASVNSSAGSALSLGSSGGTGGRKTLPPQGDILAASKGSGITTKRSDDAQRSAETRAKQMQRKVEKQNSPSFVDRATTFLFGEVDFYQYIVRMDGLITGRNRGGAATTRRTRFQMRSPL